MGRKNYHGSSAPAVGQKRGRRAQAAASPLNSRDRSEEDGIPKEKKELRRRPRAEAGLLFSKDKKAAIKVDDLRKEVEIVSNPQFKVVESEAVKEEKRKRKRGVKPSDDYLTVAVDNLENLYLDY